ncbi:hypothetical protein L1F30_14105 [Simiduia sp. 21SJ11W-1]|uniref:hypothetical protein n=1 Tax=Simiduia sp. 21SJ11W-1 TaxID=2909669 RepID=UPI0020A0340A|nr:hypothetical protein [Simiduia sp. 21SJ11W-1]UTA47291.1 hypothetical protein L1F30_14105 [Simiduia sp. 21SJ11W-1]
MQRLYYLADNIQAAEHLTEDLQSQGVTRNHVHLVAANDAELERHRMPTASPLETTDLLPAGEGGLLVGASLGLVACVGLYLTGWVDSTLAYLGLFLFCTGFGAWLGGFVGINKRHYKLEQFEGAIRNGHVLVMIDTEPEAAGLVERFMAHQPKAQLAGRGSSWNNPLHPHHL